MNWLLRRMMTLLAAVLCLALIAGPANAALTVSIPIIAGEDDVEEHLNSGDIDANSSDLELGHEGAPDPQVVGLRFRNIPIAPGIQILNASVQFSVDNAGSPSVPANEELLVRIYGELPSSASPLLLSNRPRTTNSVVWEIPVWTVQDGIDRTRGHNQRTPDLSALIQEIINHADWVAGDALNILIFPEPIDELEGEREAESYDGSASRAPALTIDYVPEPATLALVAVGLLGLRRRNRA